MGDIGRPPPGLGKMDKRNLDFIRFGRPAQAFRCRFLCNNETRKDRQLVYWLLKDVNRAINHFEMIAPGDRIAVAVSGGKDSLSLLRLLDWRRNSVPEDYELVAIHVSGDARINLLRAALRGTMKGKIIKTSLAG